MASNITKIEGQLEIDHERGVVYFHAYRTGWTVLRICQLGKIPNDVHFIDIISHPEAAFVLTKE